MAAPETMSPDRLRHGGESDAQVLGRLLAGRRSCRAFHPDPLARETIEAILAAAQRTASWCNTQPWQVVVTAGEGTERFRAALAATADAPSDFDVDEPDYRGIYLQRRRAVGWQLYEAVGIRPGDREAARRQTGRNFELFGAPHVAIVTGDRALGSYGVLDCGGFIQAVLLAAQAHGVATIAQGSIAARAGLVRRHFDLPDDRIVLCGISLGRADMASSANSFNAGRAALAEVVTWHGNGWAAG